MIKQIHKFCLQIISRPDLGIARVFFDLADQHGLTIGDPIIFSKNIVNRNKAATSFYSYGLIEKMEIDDRAFLNSEDYQDIQRCLRVVLDEWMVEQQLEMFPPELIIAVLEILARRINVN